MDKALLHVFKGVTSNLVYYTHQFDYYGSIGQFNSQMSLILFCSLIPSKTGFNHTICIFIFVENKFLLYYSITSLVFVCKIP